MFIGFLVAMLARQGATQVMFDKDRGLEILVRALGGEYFPLKNGIADRIQSAATPVTPANVEFLKVWLRCLSGASHPPRRAGPVREEADLDQALRGTLALEPQARRLSRLVEFLDPTDPEGLHARLARWCEACRGDYAWVFDNARDTVVPRLAGQSVVGFDVTEFLDHALTRSPMTLYLFHLVRQLLDGRRLVCWMDEFWRLLADPAFESFAKDGPKTWRKLNAVMCLATQSASDVLDSPISRTLVEQTPTKVFFPNADADLEEYMRGFGLTEREFKLIKEQLEPGSRMFLVKQAHHSVVCQLDLKGFDGELAVISGRARRWSACTRSCRSTGPSPTAWLPDSWPRTAADRCIIAAQPRGDIHAYYPDIVYSCCACWRHSQSPAARAQLAVIDVAAIAQLVQEVQTMQQQLPTARSQLSQAKQALQTMTGTRGMQTPARRHQRNYLPTSWSQFTAALQGAGAAYPGLSADVRTTINANAVLSPPALAALSPTDQQQIQAARQSTALRQALLTRRSPTPAPVRRDSKPDRAISRHGSEGDSRSAGADQRRARHAAERADQAAGALLRRATRGAAQCAAGSANKRSPDRAVRHAFPAGALSVAARDTWDSLPHSGPGSTDSSAPTSATTRRASPPCSSRRS